MRSDEYSGRLPELSQNWVERRPLIDQLEDVCVNEGEYVLVEPLRPWYSQSSLQLLRRLNWHFSGLPEKTVGSFRFGWL